jgi:hypothetical protein
MCAKGALSKVLAIWMIHLSSSFQPHQPRTTALFLNVVHQRSPVLFAIKLDGDLSEKIAADGDGINKSPIPQKEEASSMMVINEGMDPPVEASFRADTSAATSLAASMDSNGQGWLESSLLWKGVVAILCGLWASNFAAAKLIMAEPGTEKRIEGCCISLLIMMS